MTTESTTDINEAFKNAENVLLWMEWHYNAMFWSLTPLNFDKTSVTKNYFQRFLRAFYEPAEQCDEALLGILHDFIYDLYDTDKTVFYQKYTNNFQNLFLSYKMMKNGQPTLFVKYSRLILILFERYSYRYRRGTIGRPVDNPKKLMIHPIYKARSCPDLRATEHCESKKYLKEYLKGGKGAKMVRNTCRKRSKSTNYSHANF